MTAVTRYVCQLTPLLSCIKRPINIINKPGHASATERRVFAIPAALFVSLVLFVTSESVPDTGISAIVILTFHSIIIMVI